MQADRTRAGRALVSTGDGDRRYAERLSSQLAMTSPFPSKSCVLDFGDANMRICEPPQFRPGANHFHIYESLDDMGATPQTAFVKSALRAIEVLEHFKLHQQPRSMSEISRDLGYPHSSATVLLKTLMKLGYLSFDRRERVYFPTPKVTALGEWVPRALFGSGRVLEAMRDVHSATGEGVFLGTKNDIYLQYLKTLPSIHALRFHIDEGSIRPITLSAAGWVLLSTIAPDRIENIVRRANIATTNSAERMNLKFIEERLAQVRERGYASTENIPFLGGGTIAVLLPTKVQGQAACLAVGGVADRIRANFDRYLEALQEAAKMVAPVNDFDVPVKIVL
jgi:DNA-binding IclR family transcriptional regulator